MEHLVARGAGQRILDEQLLPEDRLICRARGASEKQNERKEPKRKGRSQRHHHGIVSGWLRRLSG
jgi:hypothetical protein